MFLAENPFYLLGIHSQDDAATITKAVKDKIEDDRENTSRYQDAGHILMQDKNRSEAEFYWLTGWTAKEVVSLVSSLVKGETVETVADSPRLSLLLMMNQLYYGKPIDLQTLLTIENEYARLSPQQGMEEINGDRERAGFAPLTDASEIERFIQDMLYEIGLSVREAAKRISAAQYGDMLYELGQKGKRGMVYYQLLVCYEWGYGGQIHLLQREIEMRLSRKRRWKKDEMISFFDTLHKLLCLRKPIYGRDGFWSLEPLFQQCRNHMVSLYNGGHPRKAEQWLKALQTCFSFVPSFLEKLAMDEIMIRQGGHLVKEGKIEAPAGRLPKEKLLFWGFMVFLMVGAALHYMK